MKIITVCGSLKFKEEMINTAIKMELKGNIVLTPIIPLNDKISYSKEDLCILGKMHKEKIKLADTILVININNYVGESTKSEIEFAKSLNKEIIYYTNMTNL